MASRQQICIVCGSRCSNGTTGRRETCSDGCGYSLRWMRRRGQLPRPKVHCKNCGKLMVRDDRSKRNRLTCSRGCFVACLSAANHVASATKPCTVCGKPISALPSVLRRKKTCSPGCRAAIARQRGGMVVERACNKCGRRIERRSGDSNSQHNARRWCDRCTRTFVRLRRSPIQIRNCGGCGEPMAPRHGEGGSAYKRRRFHDVRCGKLAPWRGVKAKRCALCKKRLPMRGKASSYLKKQTCGMRCANRRKGLAGRRFIKGHPVSWWANRLGVSAGRIHGRISRGATPEEAVKNSKYWRARQYRYTRIWLLHGRKVTAKQMATLAGISVESILARLRRGLSPEATVKPPKHGRRQLTLYGVAGLTTTHLAMIAGLPRPTIDRRLRNGWTPERATSVPARKVNRRTP